MTRSRPSRPRNAKKEPDPIVKRLREIRIERGLSQLKVASALGVERSKVNAIETGWTHDPTLSFITGYANLLGVEINVVVPDETP